MPFFYGNKETLGYTPLFENYVCCLCYETLEDDTIYVDNEGVKWDICKECDRKEKEHINAKANTL